MLMDAVESVLAQNNQNFTFIVSDNSSDYCAREKISHFPQGFEFRERDKSTTIYDHWKICLNECETDYVMLFHDDDQMLPNLINTFWEFEKKFPDFIAVGLNAEIIRNEKFAGVAFQSRTLLEGPLSESEILSRYFFKFSRGIAPFPGYIYRTSSLKKLNFSETVGKYGDVGILAKLAQFGSLFWICEPVFRYRIHGENDGLKESLGDRLKFLGWLKHEFADQDLKSRLSDYRYFLYTKHFTEKKLKNRRFLWPIRRFTRSYQVRRIFRIEYYGRFISKYIGSRSME